MTTVRLIIATLALTLSFSGNVVAEASGQLTESDLAVAGISIGADATNVQGILGKPKSISQYPYPNEASTKYSIWRYMGLSVHMGEDNSIFGITINANTYSTKRGLKVGTSTEELLSLYGKPTGTYKSDWDYELPDNDLEVMRVTIRKHRIIRIYLGLLSD